MTISMYNASIPTFIRGLNNLSAILTKAAVFAEAKKIEPTVIINSRLAPDMFPLSRQIQITTDVVKGGAARLASVDVPSFPDNEASFPELQERIKKTINFLQTIDIKQIDGSEKKTINLKVGGRDLSFEGLSYLFNFVIPNFYFHITTTYAILRHNGLDIGKADFLGNS